MRTSIPVLLFLFFVNLCYSQCDYFFGRDDVIMDKQTGNIFFFDKIIGDSIYFLEKKYSSKEGRLVSGNKYSMPCDSSNFIRPYFDEGDFIHTWEGKKYGVKEYMPRWDGRPELITLIKDNGKEQRTEESRLNWGWIKTIEKNNDFQARKKLFERGDKVYWEVDGGEILVGKIRAVHALTNTLDVKYYDAQNVLRTGVIKIEDVLIGYQPKLLTIGDTLDMIRSSWYSDKKLVFEIPKWVAKMEEQGVKSIELEEELRLHRYKNFDDWPDEKKQSAKLNYSFVRESNFLGEKEKVIAFYHYHKGRTSTQDRWMYASRWKVSDGKLLIENGKESLTFEIEELYEGDVFVHLVLRLKRYELN